MAPLHINQAFLTHLSSSFRVDQLLQTKLKRLRHAYGKSFQGLYRIRQGLISRASDLVVYPETTEQVVVLLSLTVENNIYIILFGGGTNIVGNDGFV
ncbi:FAD-binding protein [Candidatus Coxiella mudrowiae]|uniref:FAD-binding protein n=1 Tax=Candidatus Coxiella mudrowiae TaxID=2054173 RepID=UPI000C28954E|nr:FAD-binding protein [Candidatus Coxiella mudrowiae]